MENSTNNNVNGVVVPPCFKTRKLTLDQIQFFAENGYLRLTSVIPPDECQRYDREVIQPSLLRHAQLDEADDSTWKMKNNPLLSAFATGDTMESDWNGDVPPGIMVREPNTNMDPINDQVENNWAALFNNTYLNDVLDDLHDAVDISLQTKEMKGVENKIIQQKDKRLCRWKWLHPNSVGWIHVRLPQAPSSLSQQQDIQTKYYVPKTTWHVDGGHFSPHTLTSSQQSVVLLPMIRSVLPNGGGNTLLLRRSHVQIAHMLYRAGTNGVETRELNQKCNQLASMWNPQDIVEAAPCQAGDVWLLHPFLVHCAGFNTASNKFRLTFNLGVRWEPASPFNILSLEEGMNQKEQADDSDEDGETQSILEWSILEALRHVPPLSLE